MSGSGQEQGASQQAETHDGQDQGLVDTGHIMRREHYQRLLQEAQQEQQQ